MSKTIHTKLGEFFSTAICGNDILSSALYVSGIAAIFAGIYAPLVLLAVALVLFFYRTVYREVVEALPVNGGAYNALLNGTTKIVAALAGIMTILSYIATAVISAKTAVEYLFKFIEQLSHNYGWGISADTFSMLIIPVIIVVLFLFAILVISGVKDSAKVAAIIFAFHIITLIGFIIWGGFAIFNGDFSGIFQQNIEATNAIIDSRGGLLPTLFLAFSASLLGVSGFESSANFVEEQRKGVFAKTLRNMWIGITVFNPLIALVVLNTMGLPEIIGAKDFLLAEASYGIGGILMLGWIAINAFMVLCGAVLTSYVGVSGLVNRMAIDGALPSQLVGENSKGSHTKIIITFFLLCTSILIVTGGNLLSLAGVYTISFLGVMTLFALGNLILRYTRTELKRPYSAPIIFVIIAALATAVGLVGNILIDVNNILYFMVYFVPTVLIVAIIINQKDILQSIQKLLIKIGIDVFSIDNKIIAIESEKFYAFIHHTNKLYAILNYVTINENGKYIKLIHCKNGDTDIRKTIIDLVEALKQAGAFTHLEVEFDYIDEIFSPEVVDKYANKNQIPKNKIFIGSIHKQHPYDYEEFGGVRIIS